MIHPIIFATLSGDAFREWQSGTPSTNDAPLFVVGQAVTNGINSVSWGTSSTASIYVQSMTSGVSTLTYSYIGTGTASGIVCRASLKMTTFAPDLEVFASDAVKISVAPFILSDSTQPLETVYVSNADPNFVAALKAAVGAQKVVEVSATSYSDDVWVQDEVEIGYTQTPSGVTLPVTLDLPRNRGLDNWPMRELRNPNFGYFAKGSSGISANSGGNLECTPPHVKDGIEYPFGRALVSTSMEPELVNFINAQGVQAPSIALDMSWLEVGHVDEVFTFVPYGDGYKVLVADTTCALDLLEDLNVEDGGLVSGSGTNTLIATDRIWSVGQWQEGFVRIVSGTGSNQVRQVSGNTFNTLTTILPWTVQPGTNSQYQVIARSAYRCLFIEGEEDLGVVSSVTSTTLTDTAKNWPADFWKDGYFQIVSENKTTRISKILGNTSDRYDAQAEESGKLKEIRLSGFPEGMGLNAKLTKTGDAILRIHLANNLVSPQLPTGTVWTDANPPPQSLWVQGHSNGIALLVFSAYDPAKPTETIAADEVCLTVLEPASYSPSGADFYSVWFPLNPTNGAPSLPENNMTTSHGDLDTMIDFVCSQGSENRNTNNVIWYTDTTGDQDTDFGSCTLANLAKMADSGFIQMKTHGPEGGQYLCAVFAPQTQVGWDALETWGAGVSGFRIEKQSSATSNLKCFAAYVPSSWFESNWKNKVNANRSIVVWDVCYSSMYAEPAKSLMDAAEGRWRIGYADETSNLLCTSEYYNFFGKLASYPNAPDATHRTAGKAYGPVHSITRMKGNPWTTLCPTLATLPPQPIGTHPGTEQIGWGCIVFDTYIKPNGSASDALTGAAKQYLSDIRWVKVGAGYRAIGFDYDFTKGATGTGPELEVIADNIISQGNGGGQVLDGNGRSKNRDNSIHKLY